MANKETAQGPRLQAGCAECQVMRWGTLREAMGDHRRFLKPPDVTWAMCEVEGKRVEAGDNAETVGSISVGYEGGLDPGKSWEIEA